MRFVIGAMLVLASAVLPALRAQENVYDEINAAWEKRNKAVRTAEFEIKCEAFYTKGSVSSQFVGLEKETNNRYAKAVPAEDTNMVYRAVYTLKGDNLRMLIEGTRWTGSKFGAGRELMVCTAKGRREIIEEEGQPRVGHSEYTADYFIANTDTFLPLTRHFRSGGENPLSPLLAHRLKESGLPVKISDQECRAFTNAGAKTSSHQYFLSPADHWAFVRDTSKGIWQGAKIVKDVQYQQLDTGITVPKYWEVKTVFANPAISMTKRFTVTKFAVNQPIPDSTFDVTFAPGSTVFDDAFSHSVAAVVKDDGSYKPHPETSPHLLKSFHDQKRAEITQRWNRTLLVAGVFLICFGITYTVFRRRRSRRNLESHFAKPT